MSALFAFMLSFSSPAAPPSAQLMPLRIDYSISSVRPAEDLFGGIVEELEGLPIPLVDLTQSVLFESFSDAPTHGHVHVAIQLSRTF